MPKKNLKDWLLRGIELCMIGDVENPIIHTYVVVTNGGHVFDFVIYLRFQFLEKN
jgi:hypothetical protein